MRILKYSFISIVLLLLVACSVSKDVKTPQDAIPNHYRFTEKVNVQDTTSIAKLSWQDFFKQPDLQQLIDSAIVKNNDLQIARKNIEAAQWQLKQSSKWGNVPELNAQVTGLSDRPSDNSLNGLSTSTFLGKNHIEDFNAQLQLSWEVDIWKKISNQKKNAIAEYLQSEEARKTIQTAVVSGVAKAYYNLLMLDAQLKIAKRNLKLNDSTLFVIDFQYDAGQVTSLAQQQAEAQKLVAAELIPQLEQEILLQENALSILSGFFPKEQKRTHTFRQITLPESLSTGVPATLVSRRPDVRIAELQLQAANAKVGIAKAFMYPNLTITAMGGLNSFESSNWFTIPASLFGTVAGSISQPLLQRKKRKAAYEIEKVEREKAVIRFRQTVLVAAGEVADALAKNNKLEKRRSVVSQRIITLQEAVQNANMLFANGMANYLEVISAQSNLLQSELDLAILKRSQLNASVELYRALGGGWK